MRRPLNQFAIDAVSAAGLAFLGFCIVHLATLPLANGDMYWQTRAGELILQTGAIPDRDTFSYTIYGTPWNNHEWGFEILAALLHAAAGWGGFRLLVLALCGGTAAAVALTLARRNGMALALTGATGFLVLGWYKFIPAPQTVSMVLFLLGYWFFLGPKLLASWWRLAALAAYLLVWGNLTAEAVVFLPFVIFDQLMRLAGRRSGPVATESLAPGAGGVRLAALALVLLAPFLNPPGVSVFEYALLGTSVNRLVNIEFRHLWKSAATVSPAVKNLARALALVYPVWGSLRLVRARDRWDEGRRFGLGLLAVLGATLYERNLWMLTLPLVQALFALGDWARASRRKIFADLMALAAAAALFLLFLRAVPWWSPALAARELTSTRYYREHLSPTDLPLACDQALAQAPPGKHLLTSRVWANWVIWRAPWLRVFVDGRNLEYPVDVHFAMSAALRGRPGVQEFLDHSGTDLVLTTPGWLKLPGLAGAPWKRTFAGPGCALYAKKTDPKQGPAPAP